MLPDSWIERLFERMSGLYGSKFSALWEGSNPEVVRRVWAEKLAGFQTMPGAIKEALDALDSKPFPPTLPEFIALCREAAPRHQPQIQAIEYKPTAEELEAAAETIRKASESIRRAPSHDFKAWAKKLKERDEAGETLSLIQVQAYREALAEKSEPVVQELAA